MGCKAGGKPRFEAKLSGYHLGLYVLETDAALAHDGAARALVSGKDCHSKINFSMQREYMNAREEELEARGISVELEETLAFISAVKDSVSNAVKGAYPP